MNYDLAMMALEGLIRAPMSLRLDEGGVTLSGDPSAFKELARLCLLLGGVRSTDDSFELTPGVHLERESLPLRLNLRVE